MSSFDEGSLCAVVADGNYQAVERLLNDGGLDVNKKSSQGFAPLCIAAFWGYSDIVKLLLGHGADVNITNEGTGWTPYHCAAFQDHGKVLLCLIQHSPDVSIKDSLGRSAADFGSALDTIWPFFASLGCKRTSKADLIRLDIVKKVNGDKFDGSVAEGGSLKKTQDVRVHFSRPGSAYVVQTQSLYANRNQSKVSSAALAYGDVLREEREPRLQQTSAVPDANPVNDMSRPTLNMWRTQ